MDTVAVALRGRSSVMHVPRCFKVQCFIGMLITIEHGRISSRGQLMVYQAPPLDDDEIAVLAKIGELSAGLRLRLLETRRSTHSLARLQLARALWGSSALDESNVALDDITAIDLGVPSIDVDDETRLALRSYRDALTYVSHLSNDDDFAYNRQLLKSLHFMMGSYDARGRNGRWRVGPASLSRGDTVDFRYVGPDAKDVPALIDELVDSLQTTDGPPVLVRAALAHLNLIAIQPFERRNGKMARCLHTLVLARQGVLAPANGSIEEYLGRNAKAYEEVVSKVAADSFQPDRDTRPWVRFVLTAHLRQAQTLKRRLNEHDLLWHRLEKMAASRALPDRSVVALFDASVGLRVRSATYRAAVDGADFEDITEATASRDLRQAAEGGLLEAVGEKRGRHYRATTDLAALRQAMVNDRKKKDTSDPFAKRERRD